MMDWYDGGASSTAPIMWMVMGVFWLGLLALIVFLVVRLLPGSGSAHSLPPTPTATNESPEQILDRLFALGEIDEQTYRTRRTALAEMRRTA